MSSGFQKQLEKIADGLATHSYAIVEDFLSLHEVEAILQTDDIKNSKLQFKKAGIGRQREKQINESIRGDYIQWIDPRSAPEALKSYFEKLDALILYINRSLYLSLKEAEVHLTRYPIGTFYKKHFDQFRQDDHRKLSIICYLNQNWREEQGGQLRMHLADGIQDILPQAGRLVCFRSDLVEHEVLPATRERFSITGWLVDAKF